MKILLGIVIVIMILATIGLVVCLVKDLRDSKKIRERSKELTAAPEKNRFDINLELYRLEVDAPNIMGSHIRRV